MFKTEIEMFSQADALQETYRYLNARKEEIKEFFKSTKFDSVTFIGCGSSYSLCKSAELSLRQRTDIRTHHIAAGDLMMNFPFYEKLLKNTLLVVPSRSGSTSEVLLAVESAREKLNAKCICVSAVKDSNLSKIAELSIEIPWSFDESVCQTRTVTNLYAVNLFLVGVMTGDEKLLDDLNTVIQFGNDYITVNKALLKEIAETQWQNAVVLGDSELEGIAEEGALAFKEICQLQSNYYHILDVRHGPAVLIDEKTLVIIATTPYGSEHQKKLITEFVEKGATTVSVGSGSKEQFGSKYHVNIPSFINYAVYGIPFIFVPQALTFYKALITGINPDQPTGLKPWIKL